MRIRLLGHFSNLDFSPLDIPVTFHSSMVSDVKAGPVRMVFWFHKLDQLLQNNPKMTMWQAVKISHPPTVVSSGTMTVLLVARLSCKPKTRRN